jgi:hypothetical protein
MFDGYKQCIRGNGLEDEMESTCLLGMKFPNCKSSRVSVLAKKLKLLEI